MKSLKVVVFMVEANMSSEKVALTSIVGATPVVALAVGTVLMTRGGVVLPVELVIVQLRISGIGSTFPAGSVA